ncbi:MAG TPA: PAS domain S-box protein [Povalibacter sp.]|uniref:PAS domain S-box protein n=1 Tax=Povalibacter sp. TaxID=1962978 RepID=UPI002C25B81F|nr:PAS domain S-box protein [Povalibacter sp.]HMN46694.1 PAS domain S-box protein [Povalibacter sp.]
MGIRRIFGLEGTLPPAARNLHRDEPPIGVRKIVDTTREGVWLFDLQGRTTFVNQRMADMLGAKPADLIGTRLLEFLDGEDRAAAERDLRAWLARGADGHYHHLTRRDGKDLWTRISSSPVENERNSIVGLLGMFTDATERRDMEHALQRAEAQFRIVFDSSPVGIVVVNQQGFAVLANNMMLTLLGYERGEMQQVSFEDVTHPDDVAEDRRLYAALMRGEMESFRREKRYVARDGRTFWVHVNASLVRSPQGEPQYAISMVEDVTEKHKAEHALRDSTNQLRQTLDAARMATWRWDIASGQMQWSDNVHRVFDLPLGRLPMNLQELEAIMVPEDRERISREIERVLCTPDAKFVSVFQVNTENGSARWFETRGELERDAAGEPRCMLGVVVDVTTRERAELALRETEARFRTLADAAFEGIAITERGVLIDVNDRLLAMFGRPREDVIGRGASEMFASRDVALVEQKMRSGDAGMYEAMLERPDGSRTHVEIQARSFETDSGGTVRVAAVRDVTARRRAAELLRQSQERELRAREEFSRHLLTAQEQERQRLANELHDGLGQNLSLIRNRMMLALELPGLPAEVVEQLRAVAEIASDCVAEVRNLSQNLRPIQIEQLGLTEALNSLVERVRDSTTAHIESRIEDVDDVLQGEEATHLYRICQEALNNVLRHSQARRVTLSLERDVGMLHLDVRDDGIGFDTASVDGGLGLTSMRERAQMLGGTLDLRSMSGKGTHLQVNLPFTEPADRL